MTHVLYLKGVRGPWTTLLVAVPLGVVMSVIVSLPFHLYVERRFMTVSQRRAAANVEPVPLGSALLFSGQRQDIAAVEPPL
jgi:hypothetical protein